MTAPLAAQSAIETQASTVATTSVSAQSAAVAYLLAVGGSEEEAWYDTDTITSMARGTAGVIDAFSTSAAQVTDAFIADAIENLSGERYRAIGSRKTVEGGVRQGVTTAGVVGRAADTYRYQQSLLDRQFIADVEAAAASPTEMASPLDAALDRVRRGAQLNVALAGRNQAHATMARAADAGLITGYRRVMHAELSHEGSCGLCVADSTRVYRSDHLMALHPGCHCVPVPLRDGRDPGAAINDRDLGRFYSDAGGTSAQKLRETRYKVDEHGEVGPVLRPHDDPIRTHQQARRDTNRARAKTPEQALRTLRRKRDMLEQSYRRVATGQTDHAWAARVDGMNGRLARLDRQIVKLETR